MLGGGTLDPGAHSSSWGQQSGGQSEDWLEVGHSCSGENSLPVVSCQRAVAVSTEAWLPSQGPGMTLASTREPFILFPQFGGWSLSPRHLLSCGPLIGQPSCLSGSGWFATVLTFLPGGEVIGQWWAKPPFSRSRLRLCT